MKKLVLLFTMLYGIVVNAQFKELFEYDANNLYYEKVVHKENISQQDLYNQAKIFISENFKSSDNVIDFDKENEIIICKVSQQINNNLTLMYLNYNIKLEFKDNRFKYTLYNFSSESGNTSVTLNKESFQGYEHMYNEVYKKKKHRESFKEIVHSIKNNIDLMSELIENRIGIDSNNEW